MTLTIADDKRLKAEAQSSHQSALFPSNLCISRLITHSGHPMAFIPELIAPIPTYDRVRNGERVWRVPPRQRQDFLFFLGSLYVCCMRALFCLDFFWYVVASFTVLFLLACLLLLETKE